jgi:hypothetical protein
VIKASANTADGTPLLVIGLSRVNTEKLLDGQPIAFDTDQLGLPRLQVLIIGGESEQSISEDLAVHLPNLPQPGRAVVVDRRQPFDL